MELRIFNHSVVYCVYIYEQYYTISLRITNCTMNDEYNSFENSRLGHKSNYKYLEDDNDLFDVNSYPLDVFQFIDSYQIIPVIHYRSPLQKTREAQKAIVTAESSLSVTDSKSNNSSRYSIEELPIFPEVNENVQYTESVLSPVNNSTKTVDLLDTIPASDKDKHQWLENVRSFLNVLEVFKPLDSFSIPDSSSEDSSSKRCTVNELDYTAVQLSRVNKFEEKLINPDLLDINILSKDAEEEEEEEFETNLSSHLDFTDCSDMTTSDNSSYRSESPFQERVVIIKSCSSNEVKSESRFDDKRQKSNPNNSEENQFDILPDLSSAEKTYIIQNRKEDSETTSKISKSSRLQKLEQEYDLKDIFKPISDKEVKKRSVAIVRNYDSEKDAASHKETVERLEFRKLLEDSRPAPSDQREKSKIVIKREYDSTDLYQPKRVDPVGETKPSHTCKDVMEPLDRLEALTKSAIKKIQEEEKQNQQIREENDLRHWSPKPIVLTQNSLKSVRRHKHMNLPWRDYMKLQSDKTPSLSSQPRTRSETLKSNFFSPPIIMPDVLLDEDGNVMNSLPRSYNTHHGHQQGRHPKSFAYSGEPTSETFPMHYNTWSHNRGNSREGRRPQDSFERVTSGISTNQPPIKNQLQDFNQLSSLPRTLNGNTNSSKPIRAKHGLINGNFESPSSSYPVSLYSTLTLPSRQSNSIDTANQWPPPRESIQDTSDTQSLIGWRLKKDWGRLGPDEKRIYVEGDPVSELEKIYDSLDLDNENLMERADRRATDARIDEVMGDPNRRLTSSYYDLQRSDDEPKGSDMEFYSLDRRNVRNSGPVNQKLKRANYLSNDEYEDKGTSPMYSSHPAIPQYEGGYLSQKALHGRAIDNDSWLERRNFDDDLACRNLLRDSESSENESSYVRQNFMGPERMQSTSKEDKRNWWPYVRPKVLQELSQKKSIHDVHGNQKKKKTESQEENPFYCNNQFFKENDLYREYEL